MKITTSPFRPFESHEDAERVVETMCPAGYCYEIQEYRFRPPILPKYAIKIWNVNHTATVGYFESETSE